jgi:GMP synthase (glutamine-hydrolysing)
MFFKHTPKDPLGYIEQLFSLWDVPFEYRCLWKTNEVITQDATHLIFLGGPMSVNDELDFPWLLTKKDLVRRSVIKKIPILGLCLGAQLIASAHGARVYQFINVTGWYQVHRIKGVTVAYAPFPDSFSVFQMHNETFEICVYRSSPLHGRAGAKPRIPAEVGSLPPVPP